jgi:hypothetical protein
MSAENTITPLAPVAAVEPPPPPTFDDVTAAYSHHAETDRADLTWLEMLGAYIDGRIGGAIKPIPTEAEVEAARVADTQKLASK